MKSYANLFAMYIAYSVEMYFTIIAPQFNFQNGRNAGVFVVC